MKMPVGGKIKFLSHPLSAKTPLYAGSGAVVFKQLKSLEQGDSCNKMRCAFPSHAATHVDVPLHCLKKGRSVTGFAAQSWVFDKVILLKLPKVASGRIIEPADISMLKDCQLLLLKTGFEKYRSRDIYWRNSPGIHPELAGFLKKKAPSLRAVGIDFISVSSLSNRQLGRQAHHCFLGRNILLIEDMKLSGISNSPKAVIVSPLLLEGGDGAPCTVFSFGGN